MRSFIRRPTFYIVHHSALLASCLDVDDHSLEDCDFDRCINRSETMAERAPLLSRADQLGHHPPIFVRVCHSPWLFLSQRSLAFIRAILAVYMTTALVLNVTHDWKDKEKGCLLIFDARIISFSVQTIYYWITAVRFDISKSFDDLIHIQDLGHTASHGASQSTSAGGTSQGKIPCRIANCSFDAFEYRYQVDKTYGVRPSLYGSRYLSSRGYHCLVVILTSFRLLFKPILLA